MTENKLNQIIADAIQSNKPPGVKECRCEERVGINVIKLTLNDGSVYGGILHRLVCPAGAERKTK